MGCSKSKPDDVYIEKALSIESYFSKKFLDEVFLLEYLTKLFLYHEAIDINNFNEYSEFSVEVLFECKPSVLSLKLFCNLFFPKLEMAIPKDFCFSPNDPDFLKLIEYQKAGRMIYPLLNNLHCSQLFGDTYVGTVEILNEMNCKYFWLSSRTSNKAFSSFNEIENCVFTNSILKPSMYEHLKFIRIELFAEEEEGWEVIPDTFDSFLIVQLTVDNEPSTLLMDKLISNSSRILYLEIDSTFSLKSLPRAVLSMVSTVSCSASALDCDSAHLESLEILSISRPIELKFLRRALNLRCLKLLEIHDTSVLNELSLCDISILLLETDQKLNCAEPINLPNLTLLQLNIPVLYLESYILAFTEVIPQISLKYDTKDEELVSSIFTNLVEKHQHLKNSLFAITSHVSVTVPSSLGQFLMYLPSAKNCFLTLDKLGPFDDEIILDSWKKNGFSGIFAVGSGNNTEYRVI
eukprot:TRINITY_DN1051_c0_g1_i1.p1 TRINITY_DN1051_c0_g1~~TRINITY_DN1051_c0_g1_i1.p1  ORF type:complete len:464 (-),score=114.93 TRINITY_DN1051_c0_g1_i1:35-1426(-)